jgi:hypothetical protein
LHDWYTVVEGSKLEQGDVLLDCPVTVVESYTHPLPDEVEVVTDRRDLVVLTQSCDLENDKVEEVLLAAVRDYQKLLADQGVTDPAIRSAKWRQAAARGDLPAYSLLPQRTDPPAVGWSLVDFHHLFMLPKSYVEAFADASSPRLRLVPPYREHLAQAFARYVMRVGLPTSLTDFEAVKPIAAS